MRIRREAAVAPSGNVGKCRSEAVGKEDAPGPASDALPRLLLLHFVRRAGTITRRASMVRQFKHHEQKLLKKVDFLNVRTPFAMPASPVLIRLRVA
jgi:hypothetical protein